MTNNNTNHQGLGELSESVLKDISGACHGCAIDGGGYGMGPNNINPYFPTLIPPKPTPVPFTW